MKKIALVTLIDFANFGNRLQNYALQELLRSFGAEVETLRLHSGLRPKIRNFARAHLIKNETTRVRLFNRRINWSRYDVFDSVPAEEFDYFVVGSDQVWNPFFYQKYPENLLLTRVPPEKRISYAASFGGASLGEYEPVFRRELPLFKAVSVRETGGAELIKSLTGRDAEVVLDPTLTFPREYWERISLPPENVDLSKPYILSLFWGDFPPRAEEDLARCGGERRVLRLFDRSEPELFYNVGPSEFIHLIAHADLVITDSFHASAFSVLMGTPLLAYGRVGESANTGSISRIATLLRKIGMERRIATERLQCDPYERDYSAAYVRLDAEREKAREFLRKALG